MTITKKVTQEYKQEIKLPYYCKTSSWFLKVISEDEVYKVTHSETYSSITRCSTLVLSSELQSGEPIGSEEFENEYNKAISVVTSSSLEPALP